LAGVVVVLVDGEEFDVDSELLLEDDEDDEDADDESDDDESEELDVEIDSFEPAVSDAAAALRLSVR